MRVHKVLKYRDEAHEWIKEDNNDKNQASGGQHHSLGTR